MTNLSATSQALFDAVLIHWEEYPVKEQQWRIACVLRAAADQISYEDELGLTAFGGHVQAQDQLLAIAAELEGQS